MNGYFLSLPYSLFLVHFYFCSAWTDDYLLEYRAVYIWRKHGHKQLSSSIYLTEVEPFLENYAKRSPQNQTLIGSAGNLVRAEDFMAIIDGGKDEEGDLETEKEVAPSSPSSSVVKDAVRKNEGLIVFFPGTTSRQPELVNSIH